MQTKAWIYRRSDSAYSLELSEKTVVPLQNHQVRVAVQAVSLNYRDLIARRNRGGSVAIPNYLSFTEAAESAFQDLEEAKHFGKAVIEGSHA